MDKERIVYLVILVIWVIAACIWALQAQNSIDYATFRIERLEKGHNDVVLFLGGKCDTLKMIRDSDSLKLIHAPR